ncbi:hypothetical protein [Methylobacterium sp. ARG-1]|uniref:hypothetical protein n=1 Tax=Methylobacterium sp. ARG-1 TaxID=1692501 RepID=UPI000A7D4C4D|nr:hypothetical protein [Methylobacterium sp. ARG-1]
MQPEEYQAFHDLVMAQERTEVQCARYLHHARELLVPGSSTNSRIFLENFNMYGRSDFFIVAKLLTERREEENFAFFYEAKAPQLYVMEFDGTSRRCVPTYDLMQAENQLIHYTSEASGNAEFLAQHGIVDAKNVKPGGIIIGRRSDRYLRGDDPENSSVRLATRSLKLREEYFYKSTNIKVFLWDRILDYLNPENPIVGR